MDKWEYDDYEELYEIDEEEEIEALRGNIASGDCICCGAKNGMTYDGSVCFICSQCGKAVHEDTYYRWAAGYDLEFED